VAAHPARTNPLPLQRIGNYWHCLPKYEQARKAIWEAINPHTGKKRIDEAFPLELRKRTDNTSMVIEFKIGSTWRLVGSDDPNSLVGAPPVGITFSEWALSNPLAWAYLAPILEENGGWASFITTSRGRNHAFTLHQDAKGDPEWFAETLTIDDTGVMSFEAVEKQRKKYHAIFGPEAGDALIEQEYYCSFEAAVLGSYWGPDLVRAEKAGRVCVVAYDPALPVHTAWDIGVRDDTGVWLFQVNGNKIHVLGYIRAQNKWVGFYVKELERLAAERGYVYGNDYVPQDAKVREWTNEGVNDEAKTRIATMIELGRRPVLAPAYHLADGIDAARRIINHCWFDLFGCEFGLESLRAYKKEWDEKTKEFKRQPLHDWTSHAATAFICLAMSVEQVRAPAPPPPPAPRMQINAPSTATFNDVVGRLGERRRDEERL
jgi:phage terminase large subunit